MFSNEIKNKVKEMRASGKSLEEIRIAMNISKGTLSIWLKKFVLNEVAKRRLVERQIEGRRKVSDILREKKKVRQTEAMSKAVFTLGRLPVSSKEQYKLTCALMYYCEGAKLDQRMSFTNSDPDLMRVFLTLLRRAFILDESRFRVQIHLHSYHDPKRQRSFWSQTMNIPERQFIKNFQKKESGITIKQGYPGCATVRYHDAALSRELLATAREYFKIIT